MENYDEKMNYSFEPAPEEPTRPPLEQAKEEIRRSGKHTGLKIAALLAALAIVAAVGGSVLTKTIDAIGQKNLAEQESSASVGANTPTYFLHRKSCGIWWRIFSRINFINRKRLYAVCKKAQNLYKVLSL